MRSISSAGPYINEFIDLYKSNIICLSEHRLYESELFKLNQICVNFDCHAKASSDLDYSLQSKKAGHCGIAIMWSKDIAKRVKVVNCNSDRICAIEVLGAIYGRSLFVFNVYLPHQQCKISSFVDQVNILEESINKCKLNGEVVVIGDTNCHFGADVGDRFYGVSTKNAKHLLHAMNNCDLELYDHSNNQCKGPCYSFHVAGVGTSYIDHCFVSPLTAGCITKCEVHEDCILNTSDHLPISITIRDCYEDTSDDINTSKPNTSKIAWSKLSSQEIAQKYSEPLSNQLDTIDSFIDGICKASPEHGPQLIDEAVEQLVEAISTTCQHLPRSRFNPKLKPYWSQTLNLYSKEKNKAWNAWRKSGAKRDDEHFREYKEAKNLFRCALKTAEKEYEMRNMEDIVKSHEVDQTYFWRLVNRRNKTSTGPHPLKLKNGVTISKPEDIRKAWKEYFSNLYTPSGNRSFDAYYKAFVEEELHYIRNDANLHLDDIMGDELTLEEIQRAIKKLKSGKAPGWDNISAECIKYGGQRLACTIQRLCNNITKYEHIPNHFKIGIIVTIPKGDKVKTDQDNYRGITLLSVLSKLYEKCFVCRVEEWARERKLIIDVQGAGKIKCSSLHTAWIVKEAIAVNQEKYGSVYIGILDIRKAFDTLWQDGMLYKLYDVGIRGKAWRILCGFYSNFVCKVQVNGMLSEGFEAKCGIHQGAPCSMLIFTIFMNDLLQQLLDFDGKVWLGEECVNCAAFADDITLIARCKTDLQALFDIADRYSKRWRYQYNPTKCAIMIFGPDSQPKTDVILGAHVLKVSQSEPHLGGVLAVNEQGTQNFINQRIKSCQKVAYAVQSIGSLRVPVNPAIATKLYYSACISKLCYGLELINLDDNMYDQLECFHARNAKIFQGLPQSTSNVGCIGTIGWTSISAHINILKILFLWRILLIPLNCMYKRIMICRITECVMNVCDTGPVSTMLKICTKYDVLNVVLDSIMNDSYPKAGVIKRFIKSVVNGRDFKVWKISCCMYDSLKLLNTNNTTVQRVCWWDICSKSPEYTNKCRLVIRLLLNVFQLGKDHCNLCTKLCVNSIPHILFECSHNEVTRNVNMLAIEQVCPPQLYQHFISMSPVEKCKLFLNGLNAPFIPEWDQLYYRILYFIYNVYYDYHKALRPTA